MIRSIANLISFLKKFHRDWLETPGLDPMLIPDDLPRGLAKIYKELGALVEIQPKRGDDGRRPFAAQDTLMPVGRLRRVDDGMIEFAWENQGNWSARCPVNQPDPPVYSDARDLWIEKPQGFVKICDSLNHFLTTLCLQEAVLCCRHLAYLVTDVPADQVLTVPLHPLWLNGQYVSDEPDHDFFATRKRDVLVLDWAGQIWVGSQIHNVVDLLDPDADIELFE